MPSSDIHLNNDKSDFFTDFKNEFVGASILDSFNKLYDTVSWNNKADFAAFTLVPKLGDAKLVETLLYIYENKLSAYHCKEYALVHEEVGSFTISKDEFMHIYPTVSEAEQAFLNFLLISPKLVFEHYSKEYSTSIIPDCFTLYLDTKLHHPAVSALYGMLSLIDVMTNPSIVNSMGTSLQCEDINNAEIFWNQIEIINFGKVGGKQKISSFNQAFRVMQRLAPVWSQLKVSSDTMDEDDYGCVPVKTTPNVEEVVGVYQGNYALVPTTYPASSKICLGLVSNFPNFNRLSKQRKLQVSNYLLNNRAVFNEAISDSCKIITDSIARDCDNMNGLDFSSFDSKTSYKATSSKAIRLAAEYVKASFKDVRARDTRTKINYIVSCFIPIVNKFKCELMNSSADYRHVFENLNNGLQMLGGGIYDDIPSAVEETPVAGGADYIIDIDKSTEYNASQYREDIKKAQIDFNNKYEQFYRLFTQKIEQVKLPNVYSNTVTKIYPICRIFNDIAIKDAKTTIYLSGLYGKHNRNNAYNKLVDETIRTIENSGLHCFDDVANSLRQLSTIVRESANKAKDLRAKFIRARRSTNNDMIKAHDKIKIPCRLTAKDFNAFDVAVNNLLWQLRNNSSESSILSNKGELQKYIDNAKNRAALIRERFELKKEHYKFTAQQFNKVTQQNKYIKAMEAINSAVMNSCLYINNVVETYLTKEKIEQVKTTPISKSQIKKIEESLLMFRKARISNKYQDEFKKLNEMLEKHEDIFTVSNQLVKIISVSRYIDFIASVYQDLEIFGTGFNWEEFTKNMLTFMVLNSLELVCLYEFKSANGSNELISIQQRIYDCITKAIKDTDDISMIQYHSTIYDMCMRSITFTERYQDRPFEIRSGSVLQEILDSQNIVLPNITAAQTQQVRYLYAHKIVGQMLPQALPPITNINTLESIFMEVIEEILNIYMKFVNKDIALYENDFAVNIKSMGFVNTSDVDGRNNDLIINATFDSLFLNVLNIVDKYWGLKYTGNLDLPMNVTQLMRGGSVFDTKEFHDISGSKVIPEAVPFYITALNVCYYYINQLSNSSYKVTGSNELEQKLTVSDISPLYPVYDIFKNYHGQVDSLSLNQLTTCIGVFNDLWDQASGSLETKLSSAIDILLNELNASIFVRSKYQDSFQKSAYGDSNQFSLMFLEDLEAVNDMIKQIYKNAALNVVNTASPEEERIGFEKMMSEAYHKIKDIPEEQRLTELRYLLTEKPDENIKFHEYYKFMDFIISPLIICYESYRRIFEQFDAIVNVYRANASGLEALDLRKFIIDLENGTKITLWDLVNRRNLTREVLEKYVKCHPAVQCWNEIERSKMYVGLITGNVYNPVFWVPTAQNTAPTVPTNEIDFNGINIKLKCIMKLAELYPDIKASTAADFFETAIKDFCNDVDAILHLFMSYPCLSDKTINAIERHIHNHLNINDLESSNAVKEAIGIMKQVKVDKKLNDIKLIRMEMKDLPLTADENNVTPAIKMISLARALIRRQNGGLRHLPKGTRGIIANNQLLIPNPQQPGQRQRINAAIFMEGYGIPLNMANNNIYIGSDENTYRYASGNNNNVAPHNIIYAKDVNDKIRFSYTDYVIYKLAEQHPDFKLPYKLAQKFSENALLGNITKPLYDSKELYDYSVNKYNGYILNYYTQNIMRRSFSQQNRNIADDYSAFGQESVNKITATIPYLINKIKSVYELVDVNAVYHGVPFGNELLQIINVLQSFYNDISKFITPIAFMQKDMIVKNHVIGELASAIKNDPSALMPVQLAWANKYKFVDLHITYPEYKSFDPFDYINKFADTLMKHPIFHQNLDVIIRNMGRHAWNVKIIVDDASLNSESSIYILNYPVVRIVDGICRKALMEQFEKGSTTFTITGIDELYNALKTYGDNGAANAEQWIPMLGGRFTTDAPANTNQSEENTYVGIDMKMTGGNDFSDIENCIDIFGQFPSINNTLAVFRALEKINADINEKINSDLIAGLTYDYNQNFRTQLDAVLVKLNNSRHTVKRAYDYLGSNGTINKYIDLIKQHISVDELIVKLISGLIEYLINAGILPHQYKQDLYEQKVDLNMAIVNAINNNAAGYSLLVCKVLYALFHSLVNDALHGILFDNSDTALLEIFDPTSADLMYNLIIGYMQVLRYYTDRYDPANPTIDKQGQRLPLKINGINVDDDKYDVTRTLFELIIPVFDSNMDWNSWITNAIALRLIENCLYIMLMKLAAAPNQQNININYTTALAFVNTICNLMWNNYHMNNALQQQQFVLNLNINNAMIRTLNNVYNMLNRMPGQFAQLNNANLINAATSFDSIVNWNTYTITKMGLDLAKMILENAVSAFNYGNNNYQFTTEIYDKSNPNNATRRPFAANLQNQFNFINNTVLPYFNTFDTYITNIHDNNVTIAKSLIHNIISTCCDISDNKPMAIIKNINMGITNDQSIDITVPYFIILAQRMGAKAGNTPNIVQLKAAVKSFYMLTRYAEGKIYNNNRIIIPESNDKQIWMFKGYDTKNAYEFKQAVDADYGTQPRDYALATDNTAIAPLLAVFMPITYHVYKIQDDNRNNNQGNPLAMNQNYPFNPAQNTRINIPDRTRDELYKFCLKYELFNSNMVIPYYFSAEKYNITTMKRFNVDVPQVYKWSDVKDKIVKAINGVNGPNAVNEDHGMAVYLGNYNQVSYFLFVTMLDRSSAELDAFDANNYIPNNNCIAIDINANINSVFQYNYSIKDLFADIIGENIEYFFDITKEITDTNGFVTPKIAGGDVSNYITAMNPDVDPMNTMERLYRNQSVPFKVFTYLFNNGVYFKYTDSPDIFHAAMNYFRKFNIGMTTIFNNFCYSELLYNKVVFESIVKRFADVVERIEVDNKVKGDFAMYVNYISNVVGKNNNRDHIVWDASDNNFLIGYGADTRSNVYNADRFNAVMKHYTSEGERCHWYTSIYNAPTMNNNYMIELIHGLEKCMLDYKFSHVFFNSVAFRELRQLDIKCTYMSMVLLLLKHTSYYDMEYSQDVPYSKITLQGPFDSV